MKILVAGGAGYVGSKLVPELISLGYEVDVVDLFWFGNNLPANVNVAKKNILDLGVEDLRGYDRVIFLAGLSNDPMAEYSPGKNFVYNAAIPAYLAYQSKMAGVKRFILASSCSVYGYTVDELYGEESPTTSKTPYGLSKLQAEAGCLQLADENFSVIIFRKGTISGDSPRMRFDLVVNTLFKFAISTGEITINNPSLWRPILDIRDAIQGYLRAIQANQSISGIFNLASENCTIGSIGDIVAERVEKRTGRKIKINLKKQEDYRNYKVSFEKAEQILGFKSRYSIDTIIDSLFDKLDKYGDFSNPYFYNIEIFKKLDKGEI